MSKTLLVGLDIGTFRTVVMIGEKDLDSGRMKIVWKGSYQTLGMRKGMVCDLEQVANTLQSIIKIAEEESGSEIWQVTVACSGDHIRVKPNPCALTIQSEDHLVTREDVEELLQINRDADPGPGYQLLHTIPQTFTSDDQGEIHNPVGMYCHVLSLDSLSISAERGRIENLANVVRSQGFEILDMAFSGLCAALAVLTPEQKRNGVLLVDLGGGTTDYMLFRDHVVLDAGSLGVGGDHITNDISTAFSLRQALSEELKRSEGSAMLDADSIGRIPIHSQDVAFETRNISRKALHTVINARVDEIFKIIRSRLDDAGVFRNGLISEVVLTGGGAYLKGVTRMVEHLFGVPCRIGSLARQVSGTDEWEQPASFATALGLVLYGRNSPVETSLFSSIASTFKGFFGK